MEKTNVPGIYKYVSQKRLYRNLPDACYYIMYRDASGKVCREKVGWVSEKYTLTDAVRIRAERVHAVRHGDDLPKEKPEIPLFTVVAKEYLEWLKANRPKSHPADHSRYKQHLKAVFRHKRLSEITTQDLEDLQTSLVTAGSAPQTVKHVLSLVRRIINKAIALGKWEGVNPVKRITMPRVNNPRLRFLSFEEARSLLTALQKKSSTVHDMALLSLHTGMRLSEIAGLRVPDLDLNNGVIHILDPKNGQSRQAYMTDEVKAVLQSRLPGFSGGYVFKDRHGKAIREVSHTFDRAVTALGFNDGVIDRRHKVVFHTLRHTFGSWLALQGESPFVIKDLMGHRDLKMTERYTHLSPGAHRQAAATLEKAFSQQNKGDDIVRDPGT